MLDDQCSVFMCRDVGVYGGAAPTPMPQSKKVFLLLFVHKKKSLLRNISHEAIMHIVFCFRHGGAQIGQAGGAGGAQQRGQHGRGRVDVLVAQGR